MTNALAANSVPDSGLESVAKARVRRHWQHAAVALALGASGVSTADALVLTVSAFANANPAQCPQPRDSVTYYGIKRAIECAQAGDTLELSYGQRFVGPDNRDLVIDKSLTLRSLSAVYRSVLDAQELGRHIQVTSPDVELTLEGIDFRNGSIITRDETTAVGGSIRFRGLALTVIDCAFYDNNAAHYAAMNGSSLYGAFGGAIAANRGGTIRGRKVLVQNSRFVGNTLGSTTRMGGIAIAVENFVGTPLDNGIGLEVQNSAFFDNRATTSINTYVIGSFDFDESSTTVVTNSFVSANTPGTVPVAGLDLRLAYSTLAMYGGATQEIGSLSGIGITAIGTLFLGSGSAEVCKQVESPQVLSLGYNLDTDGTCVLDAATDLPNITEPHVVLRTSASGAAYVQLEAESPAVNAGPVGCVDTLGRPVLFDQLGNPRPDDSPCDIGAYESPLGETPEVPLPPKIFSDAFEPLSPPP